MDKKPLRMCAICHERKEKSDLIKIVKVKSGEIFVDTQNKINGRSVYLCHSDSCIEKAIKSKLLSRSFGCSNEQIYEEIKNANKSKA